MLTFLRLLHYTSSVCLRRVPPDFSSEMDEKLVELVRKCEELYDLSNKKYYYVDNIWKGKLWGKIDEGLKKSGKVQCFFIAHFEVTIIPFVLH